MILPGDSFVQGYEVSESVYNGFLNTFSDRNPLHVNNDYAKGKGFLSAVMHGNILNGFLSHFIGECLPEKNVIIHSQQIMFHKPVYLNQHLVLKVVVDDYFESVKTFELRFHFTNQDEEKVAKGKITIGLI